MNGFWDSVIVVGNSGSLLDLPEQHEWRGQHLVIGVNRILREGLDGRWYHPHIVVMSDKRVLATERDDLYHFDGTLVVPADWETSLPCERFHRNRTTKRHYTTPLTGFSLSWSAPVLGINNVCFQAAQLGLRLLKSGGRLTLIGAEDCWPQRQDKRRKRHHFYRTDRLPAYFRPFGVQRKLNHQWKVLVDWAASNQRHIYSSTPWRDLALPGMPYMEFERFCRGDKLNAVLEADDRWSSNRCH